MSTRPSITRAPRASAAIRLFVPGYLLVIGLALFVGAAYLFVNLGDELFVAGLAFAGGLTMWLTAVAMFTIGRRD